MKIIGITGGIGSGKSTVAAILAEKLNCRLINADALSHEAAGDDGIKRQLTAVFGTAYFDDSGELDRKALAKLIFADASGRRKLNGIIHPYVKERFLQICDGERIKNSAYVIYDCPLLIEEGLISDVDTVIVVYADTERRISYITARDGCSAEDAVMRINSQLALEEKVKVADIVIYNDASLNDLRVTIDLLVAEVAEDVC